MIKPLFAQTAAKLLVIDLGGKAGAATFACSRDGLSFGPTFQALFLVPLSSFGRPVPSLAGWDCALQ